jgi:hypothetical protein
MDHGCPGEDHRYVTDLNKWSDQQVREWEAALATLREAGWKELELSCYAAPVQILGFLPCGEEFYFRSRHDEVLLAVGGEDPSDIAPWERRVSYGQPGGHAASYLPAAPGLELILGLAAQHQLTCEHPDGTSGPDSPSDQ